MVTTLSVDDQVRRLFGLDPELIQNPYPLYARLREEAPVYLAGSGVVIVSPYDLVKRVYRDNAIFHAFGSRAKNFDDRLSLLSEEEVAMLAEANALEAWQLPYMHGDQHRRVRGASAHAFTPKRVADLVEAVQRFVDAELDERARHETTDLYEFAYRVALLVIMKMLDAPYEDADQVRAWGNAMSGKDVMSPVSPTAVRAGHAATLAFRSYVAELVQRQRQERSHTTLVSAFLEASADQQLTEEEVLGQYIVLLFAGHETTTNLITNGLRALCEHRDQWELLTEDPSQASNAIEEALRYDSPAQFFPKLVAVDTELGGVPLPAGVQIQTGIGAANRDPSVFDVPDDFDLTRRPNEHLSFGYGMHFCLGAPVSRLEGRIVFETLARRFPNLELAVPLDEIEYRPNPASRGLRSLPVRLGSERA
jgi:cytochrome P450